MLLRSKLLLSLSVLGFAAALVAPRPAAAAKILDSFDEANNPMNLTCNVDAICVPVGGSVAVMEDFPPTTRTSQLTDDSSLLIDGGGTLNYTANSMDSELLLTYALGGQDISDSGANTGFILNVLSIDTITTATVTITSGMAVSAPVTFNSLAIGENFVAYDPSFFDADFDATSLTNVDLITVHFPAGQMGEIELAEIQVPEPSTAAMLLLGLAGLACSGRRRQAAY
jgi:hypothetical protein